MTASFADDHLAICKRMAIVGYTPVGEARPLCRAALSITKRDDARRGTSGRGADDPPRIRVTLSAAPCTSG